MRDKAVITKIEGTSVLVIPLITNACLSCKEGCAKQGRPFTVSNSRGFQLATGMVVRIGASAKAELFQAVFSLLFPVLCAFAGYFAAAPAASLAGKKATEGMHAGFVLAGLFVSALLVFLVSRFKIRLTKPEITEIC